MLKRALILVTLACGVIAAPFTGRPPSAWADTPDAGIGSGSAEVPPPLTCPPGEHVITRPDGTQRCDELPPTAEQVPNPATSPLQAWDDTKAARKVGWPLLVWLLLVMVGKSLALARDKVKTWPVVGWMARRLAAGKGAMVVAGIGAIGAAGYDVLIAGGSWVAALVASGAALGGVLHSTTQAKLPA